MNDEPKSNALSKVSVVVVAAGRGERAGQTGGPKQYRTIGGKPILCHTLEAFLKHDRIESVVVAIHADDNALYEQATQDIHPAQSARLEPPVIGGSTRQLSVLAGLEYYSETMPEFVLVHDAARPFVDQDLITRLIETLQNNNAVLPAVAVSDTLKRSNEAGLVSNTVSREGMFAAQTPQGFTFAPFLAAHQKAREENLHDFTDDSALAEWVGMNVKLVEGSPQNTKITTAADIKNAETKMSTGLPDVRVGHGYDTHQLTEGNAVWLCGVEIPHTHSLSGHSDADVGLHALTDALLATVANGDIGSHFPPSDEKWRGARSDQFLAHAVTLVEDAGGIITHMDVTLVCETPKIGPHRDTMREAISKITGVGLDRVSVKATTNERIGFVGREEGLVALATATVVMGTL